MVFATAIQPAFYSVTPQAPLAAISPQTGHFLMSGMLDKWGQKISSLWRRPTLRDAAPQPPPPQPPAEKPPVAPQVPERVAQIYTELGRELELLWEQLDVPLAMSLQPKDYKRTDKFNTALKMAKAIVNARAQEIGVEAKDVTVIVAGASYNIVEAMLWLETGAMVYATDINCGSLEFLRMGLEDKFPEFKTFYPGAADARKGDIVVWIHPQPNRFNLIDLLQYSNDTGILVLQTEISDYVRAYSYGMLPIFQSKASQSKYFLPSPILDFASSFLVARRLGR